MKNFLNTTNRNVAWFKGAFDRGELDMKPPFQRNPVWVNRQKSYLIDTILNEYPIPEIYMQETVDESGKARYIIVDGQQRTRAILEFLEGRYCINGKDSPEFADMYFEDLSSDHKRAFFIYNFVVRVLPDVPDVELRTIFQRLNKNTVALNKQELRQATFWGPFIKTMNQISDKEIWTKLEIFTANDIRRMLDVEYISELAIATLHGLQNKKDNLDKYYGIYEEDFEKRSWLIEVFDTVCGEVLKILPDISRTRWSKKTDFYTLFLLFAKHIDNLPLTKDNRSIIKTTLLEFSEEIDLSLKSDNTLSSQKFSKATRTYITGIRASTDLGSRKNREDALNLKIGKFLE